MYQKLLHVKIVVKKKRKHKKGKNRAELIEIKPSNQTGFSKEGKSIHTQKASAINQAKWEAAYKWSKGKGIKFRVVTEHEIFSNTVKRK